MDWTTSSEASKRDTSLMFSTIRNTACVFRNAISEEVVATENCPSGCEFEEIRPLVAGTRGRAVQYGVVSAGQCVGLIDDIPTCAELLERVVRECGKHLNRARSRMN